MKCRWFQHLTRRSAVAEGQPASGVLFRSYQKLNGSKLVYTVKLKKYLIVFVCVCTVYLSAAHDVIMETYYYGAFGSKTPTYASKIVVSEGFHPLTLAYGLDFEPPAS